MNITGVDQHIVPRITPLEPQRSSVGSYDENKGETQNDSGWRIIPSSRSTSRRRQIPLHKTPHGKTVLESIHPYGVMLNLHVLDFKKREDLIDDWISAMRIAAGTLDLNKEGFIKLLKMITLAMSLFDLQDVRIDIGSIATLDLPMVVDLIGIYGLKGPYCTLTTTNWFLQALSVIPRGSWSDVSRRFTMIRWAAAAPPCAAAALLRRKIVSGQFDEENPFVLISSVLLVQADEGVSFLVVDRIGDIYRSLPRRADVIVTTDGARHKCQQGSGFEHPMFQFDEENPFVLISSVLLVQADEGVSFLVVDRIGDIYRSLPRRADVIVTTDGARHKCQQGSGFEHPMYVDNCY
ncbi:hypothetical protein F511_15609 [Dorcoceras hygrometricum]|uniref:Uncharacterized protein n=1 Tax=Dorcoceras hygrometricum TaxID=472368 RepID=A0A2Z7AJB3_9LAMI|nr:hypothetical protein F511_15609 [Dorcoceras hygrometricum]